MMLKVCLRCQTVQDIPAFLSQAETDQWYVMQKSHGSIPFLSRSDNSLSCVAMKEKTIYKLCTNTFKKNIIQYKKNYCATHRTEA